MKKAQLERRLAEAEALLRRCVDSFGAIPMARTSRNQLVIFQVPLNASAPHCQLAQHMAGECRKFLGEK